MVCIRDGGLLFVVDRRGRLLLLTAGAGGGTGGSVFFGLTGVWLGAATGNFVRLWVRGGYCCCADASARLGNEQLCWGVGVLWR